MKTRGKKRGAVPSVLSEDAIKPKVRRSPGKQKKPRTVRSILSERSY